MVFTKCSSANYFLKKVGKQTQNWRKFVNININHIKRTFDIV